MPDAFDPPKKLSDLSPARARRKPSETPDPSAIVLETIAASREILSDYIAASAEDAAALLLTACVRAAQATYTYRGCVAEANRRSADLNQMFRAQPSGRATEADVLSRVRQDERYQALLDAQHRAEQIKSIRLGALEAIRSLARAGRVSENLNAEQGQG